LLGPGQDLKPGALEPLAALAAVGGRHWISADPHPDLNLDAYGRWLHGAGRPPFGQGEPRHASAWGLLGEAADFADALTRGLERTPADGDWQPAFLTELGRGRPRTAGAKEAWIFQNSLPSLDEALALELRRAQAWALLGGEGGILPPAFVADLPYEWRQAAERLGAVPLDALRGAQASSLQAAELVGGLAKAAMGRVFELAYTRGFQPAPPPAAVARKLLRVAVVYPAYGGSLNLARRSAEALEQLGYEVLRVDPSGHQAEMAEAQRRGDHTFFRKLEDECMAALTGSGVQWLWILAQAPLSVGALRSLRRRGLFAAHWFCEDYRVRPAWRELAPNVDAFFPLQGGHFTEALQALGVPTYAPLPACAASEACSAPLPDESRRALSFFGAPYANRVRFFEALADLPLELFGEGWRENASTLLRPLVRDSGRLSEAQGFDLFRQSALNLNLHSSPSHHGIDPDGDYVNPRTFEIAACGGFQLCDRRRDLKDAFEEGPEIEAFSSVAELREKIGRWQNDAAGRKRIAQAARRRVLSEHTYEHRLSSALRAMGMEPHGRTAF
jgi:spore maturation protein CgeB